MTNWVVASCVGIKIEGSIHIIFFLILNKNVCFGYSSEASPWGASNVNPQHRFSWRNEKDISIFSLKKHLLWSNIKRIDCTFLPTNTPGVSRSTIKPVNAFPVGVLGSLSVLARTKYQLATPPFVIHIFCPFIMYLSPFFTALVLSPATSEPAPGSVTQ